MTEASEPEIRERGGSKRFHAFVETNDPGIVAAASGGYRIAGEQASMLGVTTASLRSTRCALPGCGKERHDPIHSAPED